MAEERERAYLRVCLCVQLGKCPGKARGEDWTVKNVMGWACCFLLVDLVTCKLSAAADVATAHWQATKGRHTTLVVIERSQ